LSLYVSGSRRLNSMWRIQKFDVPFSIATDTLSEYFKDLIEIFRSPFLVLNNRIADFIYSFCLTPEEIADVEEAWAEIERGEAKTFTNVEDLLKELKS